MRERKPFWNGQAPGKGCFQPRAYSRPCSFQHHSDHPRAWRNRVRRAGKNEKRPCQEIDLRVHSNVLHLDVVVSMFRSTVLRLQNSLQPERNSSLVLFPVCKTLNLLGSENYFLGREVVFFESRLDWLEWRCWCHAPDGCTKIGG